MRSVVTSDTVQQKIEKLERFLIDELLLSEVAAIARCRRMREFINSLSAPVEHPLCRFYRWRRYGYHCAVFEKSWVFAYETFDDGVIVRDMSHTKLLKE